MATGAPSQTSTIPYHTIPYHGKNHDPMDALTVAVAASRSEGLWAGTVRAVHTARLGRSHEKNKGKIFHEISSMWCKQI